MDLRPTVLLDPSRLQEIYDLRVVAWENSSNPSSINRTNYPNGLSEAIDSSATHFIVEHNARIVASARVSFHAALEELPYPHVFQGYNLPATKRFAFFSRLVVLPDYRGRGLSKLLDSIRLDLIASSSASYTLATCSEFRLDPLLSLGFSILGSKRIDELGFPLEWILVRN